MTGSDYDFDRDSEHATGSSVLRWLALAASAILTVFGIRLIERALRQPSPAPVPPSPTPAPAPVTRPPAPRRTTPPSPIQHKTNGSVPPELADPPLKAPKRPVAVSARPSAEPGKIGAAADLDLDTVLERLDKHSQRATYGAVAEVVGRLPVNVMRGRDKTPQHSWVVSKKTGKPSNYKAAELHPQLTANEHVIHDADELRAWLAEHG